jgi:nitrogen regulatory protein P-II 1
MRLKYVIAIVTPESVRTVETRLIEIGIGGITLTKVKGFGSYKNFFTRDWLSDHVKLEILTDEEQVRGIVDALMETAGPDIPGSGIVAVMSVETLLPLHAHAGVASPHRVGT